MNTNIVTANTNSISIDTGTAIYEAVRNNPFLKNVMGKSDSTITRHVHELTNFGKFIAERDESEPLSMQQASHWKGITANDIEDYKHYLTYVKGMRTTTITQVVYIIKS